MEIEFSLLPAPVMFAAQVMAVLMLLIALWQAPWRGLLSVGTRQHVFFAGIFSLVVLWAMAFQPTQGITLHYLGMTTACLLFGWALASIVGGLALLVLALLGQANPDVLPLTWLLTAVVPALTIAGLVWLLERSHIRNLFVFLLGIGFAGAMLTTVVLALSGLAVLALAGQSVLVASAIEHSPLLLLLVFSEGFLNGAATSTITVYFPQVVRGFNEDRFLAEP